jgi:predicted aldo/keto reductase-like oxidoreductase
VYYVYILRCRDGKLYTGITTDPVRRLAEHNGQGGRGAKYTATRRPVTMAGCWEAGDRASASRLEWRIKALTRPEKERLLQIGPEEYFPHWKQERKDMTMKNFGFGIMRLPTVGGEDKAVDLTAAQAMVDKFMAEGFNYFDTAHGYHDGASELAVRDLVSSRYPRESFVVTNKLSENYFKTEEDILPLFAQQLELTGVEYFDYYLMHAIGRKNYEQFTRCRAFETALELKKQGKIRHLGISFHDQADFLEKVLTEHPEIEVVQIQLNYLDYDDPNLQGGPVYEVCRKFGKGVLVMEPCKGGSLAQLPEEAAEVFRALGGSPASYAIRYAASFEGVFMVLSGMSTMEQVEDNLSFMKEFKPLNDEERAAIDKAKAILKSKEAIGCTNCRYCVAGCPQQIPIPALFAAYNGKKLYGDWQSAWYSRFSTDGKGKAGDCIECGACEQICPQHLNITQLLKEVAEEFSRKK